MYDSTIRFEQNQRNVLTYLMYHKTKGPGGKAMTGHNVIGINDIMWCCSMVFSRAYVMARCFVMLMCIPGYSI